jgi:hypothetical protein
LLGYHPCITEILTMYRETGIGTLSVGQFDWGGRLLKSNGGAQRFSQYGRKSYVECKGIRELDCETYKSSRDESRT